MNEMEESLHRSQIAFQGKIVAGATHEFQNHLAVIKEYNGLIRDLLGARKPDKKIIKRCVEISKSVEERTNQAAELTDRLNSFAHRGDQSQTRFRVDQAVIELAALIQREAAAHKVTLSVVSRGGAVSLVNNPVLFEYLIFELTSRALETLFAGGSINIAVLATEDTAIVRISAEPFDHEVPGEMLVSPEVAFCLNELGATITTGIKGPLLEVTVCVIDKATTGKTP